MTSSFINYRFRLTKIIYIGNKLSKKGATKTSIETLGNFLKEEGFDVVMASSVKNKLLRLLHMLWSVLKNARSADMVLIDTYSTQNFYFATTVAQLCRMLRLPYVPILRGGNLPERIKSSRGASKKLFGGAFTNVAPSGYLMEAFRKEGYEKLTYIPNTIQIDQYPFLLRKELRPKLLWVRSFASLYNPILALEVLNDLINKGYDASLTMVGPPKDESFSQCNVYATQHHLPATFTGMLSKPAWSKLSEEHDIFINTTNFDNTPVSVIEAMALGLPVVSTNVGGLPYLLSHDIDGILVEPNNKSAFVHAIEALIKHPEKSEKMSVNAREKVESFDWETVKEQWIRLLNRQ